MYKIVRQVDHPESTVGYIMLELENRRAAIAKAKDAQKRTDRGWATAVYDGEPQDDKSNCIGVAYFGPRFGVRWEWVNP